MRTPPRPIWLPAVALLLPCTFVGVLGYRWLALEREAAARRGMDAARASAAALTDDLRHDLRTASLDAARALETSIGTPPFHPPPPLPALVADAFVFDSAGLLLLPDIERRSGEAIAEYRLATSRASWERDQQRLESLEANGRREDAIQLASQLAPASTPGTRAHLLLARARLLHAAGNVEAADTSAREIQVCCPAARDEYGTSFLLYASWMRAGWYAESRDGARLARLADELREAVDRGFLGRDEDVTAMSLLVRQVQRPASQPFIELVRRTSQARDEAARRVAVGRLAAQWLSTVPAPESPDASPLVGASRRDGALSLMAVSRSGPDRLTVIVVNGERLAARVTAWAARHPSFEIALTEDAPSSSAGMLITPLFHEAPGYDLLFRPSATDPATETRRRRLFAAAIIGALTLTLLLGCLAIRDMTREIGTAALRSAFVAGVTHELKTPIASIRLLAETLRQGRARPEATGELLDTIVDESDRLTDLVDNVLTSSRIDGGAHVYRPRAVSPADIVRSALRRFDSVLRRGGFVLTQQIDEAPLRVVVDPDGLERSILNLLGNAVKYSGTARRICVRVGRHDGHAEISVVDEGLGVPASEQQRIFERFYRSPSAAADTAGTGLGLALARHFVEAHGGRISVRSDPGRGSIFSISLPLAEEQGAD